MCQFDVTSHDASRLRSGDQHDRCRKKDYSFPTFGLRNLE